MLLRSLRPLVLPEPNTSCAALPTFSELGPWDRAGVALEASQATVEAWLKAATSTGESWSFTV